MPVERVNCGSLFRHSENMLPLLCAHKGLLSTACSSKSSVMLLLCLAVLDLIVSSPCAAAPLDSVSGLQSVSRASTRNKLLLISFDGFRWDYDRDVDTPSLDKMAQDGVKAEYVTPPFLTITSPTHFTLLTGMFTNISLPNWVIHLNWFYVSKTTGNQTLLWPILFFTFKFELYQQIYYTFLSIKKFMTERSRKKELRTLDIIWKVSFRKQGIKTTTKRWS